MSDREATSGATGKEQRESEVRATREKLRYIHIEREHIRRATGCTRIYSTTQSVNV